MESSIYTIQMVSTRPWSLKDTSLKMAPTVGTVGRTYISKTGEGIKKPLIA